MDAVYFWPDRPALSLLALWGISVIALWAAREPMFELIERVGKNLEELLEAAGRWCTGAAEALYERSRSALLAAGGLDLQTKLEQEFHRIEDGFSERLGQYSGLHRRLDDLLQSLEQDYQQSGDSPPDVPGWTAAVESIAGIPHADDPNVHMILEGVRKSLDEAQKKALHLYRADTAERHGILDRMRSLWKEVTVLQERMSETLARALETASRVNGYIDEYSRVRNDDRAAARSLSYSASKTFAVALFVVCVLSVCAFVSFELIAAPLVERMPGATLLGASLAKLSAGLIVLVHIALGVFVMDGVGITELLPRLGALAGPRRRRLLVGGGRQPVRAGRDRGRARRSEHGARRRGAAARLRAALRRRARGRSARHAARQRAPRGRRARSLARERRRLALLPAGARCPRARERAAERLRRVREPAAPHRALARAAAARGRSDAPARAVERIAANAV